MADVAIVDTGVANLASMRGALARLGANAIVTGDPAVLRIAPRLVVPGVGTFGAAMARLRVAGADVAIGERALSGAPVLGACLGLQLLSEGSEESPGVAGLGLIAAQCRRLPDTVRVPHLGWNGVSAPAEAQWLASGDAAFANSYALTRAPAGWRAAWTTYGTPFVSALERDNVLACQFHPELSGAYGEALLHRWLSGGSRATAGTVSASLCRRVIACLDVQNGRIVKGVRFQQLRDAGDPATQAQRYEAEGVDEIVLLDIGASAEARATQVDCVRRVRAAIRIPFTVGGGVRTEADARRLLEAGADRVSINSAALRRPDLLGQLAGAFGRQCVVLAIDARRRGATWEALADGGRAVGHPDVVEWAATGAARGAGEVLLTSWDADGTRRGHDLALLNAVVAAVRVPVMASGGIGCAAHAADAFTAGADAVLAASVFHDGDTTVGDFKAELASRGIPVRQ